MSAEIRPTPPSPGVGLRRKGPKSLPKLPLSVFTPPNSGTSERFPLAPSPSVIHPANILDAHVTAKDSDLSTWKKELDPDFSSKLSGVIISLQGKTAEEVEAFLQSSIPILSYLIPLSLESEFIIKHANIHPFGSKASGHTITVFKGANPTLAERIKWALQQGFVADIDVQLDLKDEAGWEALEELLDNVVSHSEGQKSAIVLSNILPPGHPLDLPIVKLLTHPLYNAYQKHIAALSLYPGLLVKFTPPAWNAPTPTGDATTSTPIDDPTAIDSKDKREWKRRVKMYLGPAVEAFGYQRILFGSSPSPASTASSSAGAWYSIARESLAELGLEQSDIDCVFFDNAKRIYTKP